MMVRLQLNFPFVATFCLGSCGLPIKSSLEYTTGTDQGIDIGNLLERFNRL
jgi:hypothetical protein